MPVELQQLVADVAACIKRVDARRPEAANARTGTLYQPGIGPHTETAAVALIADDLATLSPERYMGLLSLGVSYPGGSREKCDLCIGTPPSWEWAIEIKMLRLMGDNGKPNDNIRGRGPRRVPRLSARGVDHRYRIRHRRRHGADRLTPALERR